MECPKCNRSSFIIEGHFTSIGNYCSNCQIYWYTWQQLEINALKIDILKLRKALWMLHPSPINMKYGDDGEMQLQGYDFKRDPIEDLVQVIVKDRQTETDALQRTIIRLQNEATAHGNELHERLVKINELTEEVNKLKEELKHKEICICAAVKTEHKIIRGYRHCDCFAAMQRLGITHTSECIQGFITSRNRFVDRREAYKLQIAAGIQSADRDGYGSGDVLLSEDLY